MIEDRRVSKEEGEIKAAERKNCLYHETSALTGEGVEELFEKVIEEYVRKKKV